MSSPWLSVIVPTYNGSAHLHDALASVAAQDLAGLEILAVDDGSTDDTLSVLERFQRYLPLRLLSRPRAGNWVAGTNHALAHARGEWVCFLHQDDRWTPGRLAVLRPLAERHRDVPWLLHPSLYIDPAGRRVGRWSCPLPARRRLVPSALLIERLLIQNFVAVPAPLFRRDVAVRVGGLDEDLWYTADWDFWLKLAAQGPTAYVSTPLAEFRVHPASQTLARSGRADEMRRQLETVLDRHLPDWERRHPGRDTVRDAARFSVEMNVFLASSLHGRGAGWSRLPLDFLGLGWTGCRRYVRDSRIVERIAARIRAGLGRPGRARRSVFGSPKTGF